MSRYFTFLQLFVLYLIISAVIFTGCGEKEEEIPLSKIPKVVLAAAQSAVEGIEIKEVEIEKTSDWIIYELEGTADGKTYEIEITPEGKIIEVELADDEVEDEDDTDDDEDENNDKDD